MKLKTNMGFTQGNHNHQNFPLNLKGIEWDHNEKEINDYSDLFLIDSETENEDIETKWYLSPYTIIGVALVIIFIIVLMC